MANATINLHFTKSGYVKQSEPYTVFPTDSNTFYEVSNAQLMYFGVEAMPQALRHNALISMHAIVAAKNYGYLYLYPCVEDFDPGTLTYSNKPDIDNTVYHFSFSLSGSGSDQLRNLVSPAITHEATIKSFFRYKTSQLFGSDSAARFPFVKTVLADGVSLPSLVVTYDDSAKITSKVSYSNTQLSGNVNPASEKTLVWDLVKDTSSASGFCSEEVWDQDSAEFRYRVQGESTWQSITVTGNTKGVTIPAYTFETGNTYEYQISVTDEDGTTTETAVYTFTTPATQITPSGSPTSGYVNPRNARSFGWYYGSSAGTVGSGNTTLHWRVSGESAWNDVAAAQGADSLTIPANTFPTASTIEWYLSGTDSTGYASQTSVYSFSTAAGAVTAQAVSPSNTVQSNNQPITFNWTYSSPDGFAPSRYKFMWKLVTDADWTTLIDSAEVVNTYTFPAYTFPAGEIRWGVVPYNIDGVAGTGQSVTFVCYGAPDAPVVYAENVPFTTVNWQASDQQAYQIRVDDTVYGPYFGTEKTFQIPDKLEDGEHTVGVSVVGTYGLWSEWGTSVINVQNVPGAAIVLGGTEGIDTFLSWITAEATSDFLVFRDGVQIGHTEEITFVDRYAAGEHTYKVINRLSDGNYSESNEVTLDTNIDGTYISLLSGGEWLKIKYMLKSASDQEYEESVETVYTHLAGDHYPSVSISNYYERSLKYSAVFLFTEEADHTKFKSMLKRPVIMKFENGNVIVAVIDSWTVLHRKHYYTAYTFSLRQIEWEDYVDDTT